MSDKQYKIAINYSHVNKHPPNMTPEESRQWFSRYNGRFVNRELPMLGMLGAICEGFGITAWCDGYRKRDNFISAQHVGLDFDNGDRTLEQLATDPFIAKHAAFVHTTASHTPEYPKLRAVFLLDRPVANAEKIALLATALVEKFGAADPQCKDAARFFYGSKGCEFVVLGNEWTLENAAETVAEYQSQQQPTIDDRQAIKTAVENVPAAILTSHRDKLLEQIANAPDGEKHATLLRISRTFGGYVASGYYSYADAQNWLQAEIGKRQTVKSMTAAHATIANGLDYGMAEPLYFELSTRTPEPPKTRQKQRSTSWRDHCVIARLTQLEREIMALDSGLPVWAELSNEYQKLRGLMT